MTSHSRFENWKREIYPKYWSKKSREYGLDAYCAGLLKIVKSYHPQTVFELGIGNGFPFAENLAADAVSVSGCDISAALIDELKSTTPVIAACIGGYEDYEQVRAVCGEQYDVVYCLRSTWYFPNIEQAIDFMLGFVKPGGVVIFDIMNADSVWNKRFVLKKNILFPVTVAKNLIKFGLNYLSPGRYVTDVIFGVRELMYSRSHIADIMNARNLRFECLDLQQVEEMTENRSGSKQFSSDQKLTFIVYKD